MAHGVLWTAYEEWRLIYLTYSVDRRGNATFDRVHDYLLSNPFTLRVAIAQVITVTFGGNFFAIFLHRITHFKLKSDELNRQYIFSTFLPYGLERQNSYWYSGLAWFCREWRSTKRFWFRRRLFLSELRKDRVDSHRPRRGWQSRSSNESIHGVKDIAFVKCGWNMFGNK